jgi:hypothetical protein
MLLLGCVPLKILHMSRVAQTSDVLDAIRKVAGSIVDGMLQMMKFSDAHVEIAQITLPIRLGEVGGHLISDHDCTAVMVRKECSSSKKHSCMQSRWFRVCGWVGDCIGNILRFPRRTSVKQLK